MKNILKSKIVLFTVILLMLLSPLCIASNVAVISDNTDAETTDEPEASYEFIASDLYKFDSDVVIDSIVDGNVFTFGNNVTISGEIGGDVFVFGDNVTISDTGYIHGSIFVMGKDFTMNGICYDVYGICSSNFTLGKDAIIARDLRLVANNTSIYGQIKRDAYLVTKSLVFPNDSKDLIAGNLEYSSNTEFEISDGLVGGTITYNPIEEKEKSTADLIKSYVSSIISSILYSLVIVLLIIWLAPNFKERAPKIFKKQAPLSLGVGILASIAIVVIAFALLILTGGLAVGISIAAVTIFILALTISQTVFSLGCSKLIVSKMNKDNNVMLVLFTELLVLAICLIGFIPFVGGLIGFATSMIGLGIIILNLISKKKLDDESQNVDVTVEK